MLGDNIPQIQLADVAGALSYRQGQIDKDEARRKEIVTNQLASKALSAGLKEGTPLYDLAMANPQAYVGIAKTIGIDPADGSGMHQMATDSAHIAQLMNVDDSGALAAQYMQSEADRRGQLGMQTDYLSKGLQHLQQNPNTFKNAITMAASNFNPQKSLSESDRLAREKFEYEKANAGSADGGEASMAIKNLREYKKLKDAGDPDAESFAQSVGLTPKENKKLSPFAEKEIGKASDEYTTAISSANRYKALAAKLDQSALAGGVKGTWGEWIKEQTGNQDELTSLRKEALQISSSEAINNLPPGAASESDVKMAREPLPTEKSDPKYVAKWLGAIGRLREKEAEYHQFKADFISKNDTLRSKEGKSLASAWKEAQAVKQPEVKQQSLDDLLSKY